jgi:hypothetical protein
VADDLALDALATLDRRGRRAGVRIGLVTFALAGLWVLLLLSGGSEPIDLMFPGDEGPSADLVADQFGEDALHEGKVGYDGQQFWAIATTFPDLDGAVPHLDDARYRYQRVLTPALASVGGDGNGAAALLLLLGAVGAGIGGGALADLAVRHRRPAWVGILLFFPLALSVAWGLSDALAFGLGLLGVTLADRSRYGWAAVAFALGALAREPVAIMALATGFGLVVSRTARPREVAVLAVPLGVVLAWMAFLAWQLPTGENDERLQVLGFVDGGISVVAVVVLAAGLLAAWTWRDVPAVWPIGLLFVAMTLVYGPDVFRFQVAYRAAAPAFALALAGLLAGLARPAARREHWRAVPETIEPDDARAQVDAAEPTS